MPNLRMLNPRIMSALIEFIVIIKACNDVLFECTNISVSISLNDGVQFSAQVRHFDVKYFYSMIADYILAIKS